MQLLLRKADQATFPCDDFEDGQAAYLVAEVFIDENHLIQLVLKDR